MTLNYPIVMKDVPMQRLKVSCNEEGWSRHFRIVYFHYERRMLQLTSYSKQFFKKQNSSLEISIYWHLLPSD